MSVEESRLRDGLARLAATAPAYDVLAGARLRHRRRRIRQVVVAAVVLLVLAVVAAGTLPALGRSHALPPAGPAGTPSLPSRVDLPRLWTPDPRSAPAGPAAAVLSGPALRDPLHGTNQELVGLTGDSYRVLRCSAGCQVGSAGLLSPDGGRLLTAVGKPAGSLAVLDLTTGRIRVTPGRDRGATVQGLAWSPDGRSVAASVTTRSGHGSSVRVELVDLTTGARQPLPGRSQPTDGTHPAVEAAFSPDGARVAYQIGASVVVHTFHPGPRELRDWGVPASDMTLAGPGAWTPDGYDLAFSETNYQGRGDDRRLVFAAAITKITIPLAVHYRSPSPAVPDAIGLRVLGWRPDGSPVVVASYPRAGVNRVAAPRLDTDPADVARVKVLVLGPGRGGVRTLLAPPAGVLGIDVAARAIRSGAVRPRGAPPAWPQTTGWWAAFAAVVLVPVLLVVGVVELVRRLRRRLGRRAAATPGLA